MTTSNDIHTGRHSVFNLHVHLVFVTKYRSRVFTPAILEALRNIFEDVCLDFGAKLLEFNGEEDHVHLLVRYPPKAAVSHLVNSLKRVSSRHLRRRFPELERRYWKGTLWSPSYFCRIVWWSANLHHPAVHRTAKNSKLSRLSSPS